MRLAVLLLFGLAPLHAVYFDFGIIETPMMVLGTDTDNNEFYSFFNLAQFRASLNINDSIAFRFRLTDTYLSLSNSSHPQGTNKIYIDRLNFHVSTDAFRMDLGRELFTEGEGMVLANLSDGLQLSTRLLGFEQRAYIMYSGLIPQDVNDFNVTSPDRAEGSRRLQTGLYLEKYGLLLRSLSLGYLYSADLNTNNTEHYNPHFLSLNLNGKAGKMVSYTANLAYGLGTFGSNVTVSSLGLDLQLRIAFSQFFAVQARFAYASGDQASTTNSYETFNALGVYNTGLILVPDFANLVLSHLAVSSSLLQEKMVLSLNLLYLNRATADDTLNGFYSDSGTYIGTEFSAAASWRLDPNLTLFVTGGKFWKGNAFLATDPDIYKVIGGIQFSL